MTKKSDAPEATKIPTSVSLEPEMKKIVLAGVKFILARFKQNGFIDEDVEYKEVLRSPELMQKFIGLIWNNLDLTKDLFVDKSGKSVFDGETELVCGATLGQLERMLVYTCSSKIMTPPDVIKTKQAEPKKKEKMGFLNFFGGKKGDGKDDKEDKELDKFEAKMKELKKYLVHAWQLPLVENFDKYMEREHYRVLAHDMFLLKTPEQVAAIGKVDPQDIAKVKKLAPERFDEILERDPSAISGMALIDTKSKLGFIHNTTGPRVWNFFSRDHAFILEVLSMDEEEVWAIGNGIADLTEHNIVILKRLNHRTLKTFMSVFLEYFDDLGPKLLCDKEFGTTYLKPVVEEFVNLTNSEMTEEQEINLGDIMGMKWDALKKDIITWYNDRQKAA